jgi:hypothetical protein
MLNKIALPIHSRHGFILIVQPQTSPLDPLSFVKDGALPVVECGFSNDPSLLLQAISLMR